MKDRGGLTELLMLIEKSAYPILITANDIWNKKFNLLRKKSEVVALKELDYKDTLKILDEISKKEDLTISTQVLISISVKARGDVRAAINDLQVYSQLNDVEIGKVINERNKEESIFVALKHIFKNKNIDEKMIGVYDEVNMPIDQIFLWIEENIPLEYKGEDLAKAYDALSLADVFRGRIYRKQHWRFMVYEYFLLGAGIAASKKYNRSDYTQYKKPTRILKIWLANQRFAKKKTICQKYAKRTHTSTKRAMKDFLLIKEIIQNETIQKNLRLTSDEIEYIKG
jgi:replication factor C large subunit